MNSNATNWDAHEEPTKTFFRQKTGTERRPSQDMHGNLFADPSDEKLHDYYRRREEMLKIEREMHFSFDLESTFTDKERSANKVLMELKKELKNPIYDVTNLDYFENLVRTEE